MKQYLLSVHGTHPEVMPPADVVQKMIDDVDKVNQELRESGHWVFAGGLTDPGDATVVRAERGEILLTDGPYVETKEQIGGFWVIKARDLDEALAWAGKATVACGAPVEVRPFQEETED
jgi:hypothetical protein